MKKLFCVAAAAVVIIAGSTSVLTAGIVDELNYVNADSDVYGYVNFSQIIKFLSGRGVDVKDLDLIAGDETKDKSENKLKAVDLKVSDINEMMLVMNSRDIEKKSGYLVFISCKKGKGNISGDILKNKVKLKSGTAYKVSADDGEEAVFTKIDDIFVIGSADYVEAYLAARISKKTDLSLRSSLFVKEASSKAILFHVTVSDYLKSLTDTAINTRQGMPKGLKDNIFIQTILSLESADWGIELNDTIVFRYGLQGTKKEDSERLQMLCHTWIVAASFVVSFADTMTAQNKDKALSEMVNDQKLMAWLQKSFGRIHADRKDMGVSVLFEMNSEEADYMVSYIKKGIEEEKKAIAERVEMAKISKLTLAVKDNNIESVKSCIKEKYNLNGIDSDGNTPLCVAAMNGNVVIAKLLVEKSANVNTPGKDKLTPLHQAVKAGSIDMVVFLLSKGSSCGARGESDMTALHYNAAQGNAEITKILITKGAEVNALDTDLSSPLHYAASAGFIEIVKVLVANKADGTLRNNNDQRAIDLASQNNQTEVVEFLKTAFKQEPAGFSFDDYNMNGDSGYPGDESGTQGINPDLAP